MTSAMKPILLLWLCTTHCVSPREEPEAAGSLPALAPVVGTWAVPVSRQGGIVEQQGQMRTIALPVDQFDDASFDRFGFYDGSGRFEHAYGGDGAGAFIYPFAATPETPRRIEVSARLSAESQDRGAAHETSDVTLLINGVRLLPQTVQADDGLGSVYTWTLSDAKEIEALKLRSDGSNELRFSVDQKARNKRGLCIYGRSLNGTDGGTPIRISMDLGPESADGRKN